MPGFSVPMKDGVFGGHGRAADANTTQYYYNYTWQIFQLFETFATTDVLIHLKDLTLPTFTANQDSYTASSLEYKWAKSVTWDDVKVTWYDTLGLAPIVRRWRTNIWNPTHGLQSANDYKKRSQIDIYLPDGTGVITWCLFGSWPKIIRQGELTYTSSDVKTIEVTVAYDWATDTSKDSKITGVYDTCANRGEISLSSTPPCH